ncbi:hypothetical protein [Pedobacter sp. Hv1]|uniref:hypothetical protein n=1 Tax=Pedobacter sp. Hv1 TaxID=1740090 RepID=UPI0006D8B69B|nr:hypothetical protein [Pedobacter sp. Hv1]KQC00606.1 hypothetical protein AQF98_07920 [Pedobacter sp. Hv1]
MKNQQLPKKEEFKIVSRPSNEEIEEDGEGHYQSRTERYEEQTIVRLDDERIAEDLSKIENNNNEPFRRLEDK